MRFNIDIEKFEKWLMQQGAEILPVTNSYEALRFKGKEIGIIYTSGKASGLYAYETVKCFQRGVPWDGKPIRVGGNSNKKKTKLIDRDGTKCFFCGYEMGEDTTIEHLIPLSMGGPNDLHNTVLCHDECNQEVGNLPIVEKIKIALIKRLNLEEV